MERSEPTLVPEWLKCTGNTSGGGNTSHHSASSSSHLDDRASTPPTRNKSSYSIGGDYDSPRSSTISDRNSYFRRSSSSNGSAGHGKDPSRSYSSFSRSHREKDWDKDLLGFHEKERSLLTNHRDHNYSDLVGISPSWIEKDMLRRSQSMVSDKKDEVWPKKVVAASSGSKTKQSTGSGVSVGGTVLNNIQKATFERDFPSLGAEEKGVPEIGRVLSPGLGTAIQNTMGTSVLSDGWTWTSALIIPATMASSNNVLASSQQASPVNSKTSAPSTTSSRNMAETLAQTPSRACTAPQSSVEAQRLEELELNRSRQLIPLVLNSEKQKPKAAVRSGELTMANKIGQTQLASSHHVNPLLQGGPARTDGGKASHGGKLLVLKSTRDKNGITSATNDGSSPKSSSIVATSPLSVAPSAPLSPKIVSGQRNLSPSPSTLVSSTEKKPSQAQSRSHFFNLVRMKSSSNPSSVTSDSNPLVSLTSPKKSSELIREAGSTSSPQSGDDNHLSDLNGLDWSAENGGDMGRNGNISEGAQQFLGSRDDENLSSDTIVYPDEEEAKFLRSLGWDENEEGGGLTADEINSFYQSVQEIKTKPALKLCQGNQQLKLQTLLNPHIASASSGFNSYDSKSEA